VKIAKAKMIRSIIKRIRYKLWIERREYIQVQDLKGNQLRIRRDWLHELAYAEIIDAAALQEKSLVWHKNYTFCMGFDGLREVIEVAQMYTDVEVALVDIASTVTPLHPEED